MINSRFELKLNIEKSSKVLTPAQLIFKEFSDSPSSTVKPAEPGVTIRDERHNNAFTWKYDSCGIVYEDVSNYDECINNFIRDLERVNKVAPINKLTQKVISMYWVLPTNPKYNFQLIESKYRSVFMKDIPLLSNVCDSTIVVESKINSWVLHHQSGAMTNNQLQDAFRIFKLREGYPKLFLFLSTTITSKELVDYSAQSMREFIQEAFIICKSHSDRFQGTMEEVL